MMMPIDFNAHGDMKQAVVYNGQLEGLDRDVALMRRAVRMTKIDPPHRP